MITSIAAPNKAMHEFAHGCRKNGFQFVVIGDVSSPPNFNIDGCDFYSIAEQEKTGFEFAKLSPKCHYARKNIGYLISICRGANVITETDDDNYLLPEFWVQRKLEQETNLLINKDWVNVYKYFTESHIWPRGFSLGHIHDSLPLLDCKVVIHCPIQQGLADDNPDVDAIYRLTMPLPITFNKSDNIALGHNTICPFNSQNTTWFKKAFPLLYLPSYCSFRMVDIWRSFVAQRIAWSCGWPILFHCSTVKQERNKHNLLKDFADEISGYKYNAQLCQALKELNLHDGVEHISSNMRLCYNLLIDMELIDKKEMMLLESWLYDINNLL